MKEMYTWAFGFAPWVRSKFQWKCPGAIAGFITSQLLVVEVILSVLMARPVRLKSYLTELFVLSESHVLAQAAVQAVIALTITLIEYMTASGSSTFYLMFKPDKSESCDYEGDVVITTLMYLYMWIVGLLSLVLLSHTAMSVRIRMSDEIQHKWLDLISKPKISEQVREAPCAFYFLMRAEISEQVFEAPRAFCHLMRAVVGVWTPEMVKFMGLDAGNGEINGNVHWPTDRGRRRNEQYLIITSQIAAACLQMIPLGAVLSKLMMSCNVGYVLYMEKSNDNKDTQDNRDCSDTPTKEKSNDGRVKFPERRKFGSGQKAASIIRFLILFLISVMGNAGVSKNAIMVFVYIGLFAVVVEATCQWAHSCWERVGVLDDDKLVTRVNALEGFAQSGKDTLDKLERIAQRGKDKLIDAGKVVFARPSTSNNESNQRNESNESNDPESPASSIKTKSAWGDASNEEATVGCASADDGFTKVVPYP